VSFDLAVLAMSESADQEAAIAMAGRCWNPRRHGEGEVDERIAAFYGELRSRFPDDPTAGDDCPWMVMPLGVGIDHVIMHLSLSPRTTAAIEAIQELAARRRLVLYDPQPEDVYLPRG
jgi:hypothetical protein